MTPDPPAAAESVVDDTPPRRSPVDLLVPAAIAVTVVVRLVALFGIGAGRHPVNFDEGAYFTAAALWARGWTLHSEVTAVHPPGTTYVLAPFTFLGSPATAFAVTRIAMIGVAAVNAALIARIARRFVPLWAAAVGVAVYAVLPDAALADRSVVIEPLLNLACLLAVARWLRSDDRPEPLVAWQVGALLGVALTFKAWAILLLVPIACTVARDAWLRTMARVAAGGAISVFAVSFPILVRAPTGFWREVVEFQANRRDVVPASIEVRILRVLPDPRHLLSARTTLLAVGLLLVAAAAASRTRLPRETRFAGAWLAAIAVTFVIAPIGSDQYNTHLAPAVALLVAWGAAACWDARGRATAPVRAGLTILLLAIPLAGLQSLRLVRAEALDRTQDTSALAPIVRRLPACVFSFEAGWLIVGDRFPDPGRVGPAAADPYVTALIAANEAGEGDLALAAPAARRVFRDAVERCDVVLLGPRGRWHLGPDLTWFEEYYEPVATSGDGTPDVWRRKDTG